MADPEGPHEIITPQELEQPELSPSEQLEIIAADFETAYQYGRLTKSLINARVPELLQVCSTEPVMQALAVLSDTWEATRPHNLATLIRLASRYKKTDAYLAILSSVEDCLRQNRSEKRSAYNELDNVSGVAHIAYSGLRVDSDCASLRNHVAADLRRRTGVFGYDYDDEFRIEFPESKPYIHDKYLSAVIASSNDLFILLDSFMNEMEQLQNAGNEIVADEIDAIRRKKQVELHAGMTAVREAMRGINKQAEPESMIAANDRLHKIVFDNSLVAGGLNERVLALSMVSSDLSRRI